MGGSFGQVSWSLVREMLESCATGSKIKLKEHRIWILWNGKIYRGMPKGPGRSEYTNHDVKVMHVRQMVTYLGISMSCAKRFIPQLSPGA
jgi:hypothetical protein